MLTVFPLGLLATAVIFDAIYLLTGTVTIAIVAYWMIVAGIVGGLGIPQPFGSPVASHSSNSWIAFSNNGR